MRIKRKPQKNALVPVEKAVDRFFVRKITRRGLGRRAAIGVTALVLQGLLPRASPANPLFWLGRVLLGPLLRLIPRTIPRAFGRGAARSGIGSGISGALRAIPRGQTSILGKALAVADGAMIASMVPDLVYALENHQPKKHGELPPTPWLKDGRNDLELVITNTMGRGIKDELWIELVEYDSEEPISTVMIGELLIPIGEGKTFPLENNHKHNKFVVNGLPERVPVATMLRLRGFLPNHPNVLVETSGPILVADSGSITYISDLG